jgi:ankyrin repeat protein
VANLLISRGANIEARERGSGRTPLDVAVSSSVNRGNGQRMTELLLSKGANPRTSDSQRESALERAASHGDVAVVQSLLDGGADPNAAGRDTTPLGAAAYQGHTEVIALLLARGADASRSVPGSRVDGNGAPLAMALLPQAGQATVCRLSRCWWTKGPTSMRATTRTARYYIAQLLADRQQPRRVLL